MKILYMGTPDFASIILNILVKSECEVVGVVSQPDKPKGRGHKLMPTDVKKAAEAAGLTVYQPESLKDGALMPVLEEFQPDVIVVAHTEKYFRNIFWIIRNTAVLMFMHHFFRNTEAPHLSSVR